MALELIKVVAGQDFESFRNCFFNLAIPVVVLTEPAKVKRTMIRLDSSAFHTRVLFKRCLLLSCTESVSI